jgi:uncharacterized membrane protein (GlpM family)
MGQILVRIILGGLVVAAFAVVGDVLKPKRFAGLFGAAPAVALATLALTFMEKDAQTVSTMGQSMVAGAAGFLAYSIAVGFVEDHVDLPGWLLAGGSWLVWFAVSFAVWGLAFR